MVAVQISVQKRWQSAGLTWDVSGGTALDPVVLKGLFSLKWVLIRRDGLLMGDQEYHGSLEHHKARDLLMRVGVGQIAMFAALTGILGFSQEEGLHDPLAISEPLDESEVSDPMATGVNEVGWRPESFAEDRLTPASLALSAQVTQHLLNNARPSDVARSREIVERAISQNAQTSCATSGFGQVSFAALAAGLLLEFFGAIRKELVDRSAKRIEDS